MFRLKQLKKAEYQEKVFSEGLNDRNILRYMKSIFTVKNLDACRFPFQIYQVKNGKHAPIHTSISLVDSFGNYLCSFTHFIKTNQPAADTVISIIDGVNKNKKNNEALNVIQALREIRKLYLILHGKEVRHHIKKMLKEFNLDLYGDNYIFKKIQDKKEVYEKIPLTNIEKMLEDEKIIEDNYSAELPSFSPY